MRAPQTELDPICPGCNIVLGRSEVRCRVCGIARPEIEELEHLIGDEVGGCVFCGRATSIRLPHGDFVSGGCLRGLMDAGWLNDELSYTLDFFDAHPPPVRLMFEKYGRMARRMPFYEVDVPLDDGTFDRGWASDEKHDVYQLKRSQNALGHRWRFPPLTYVRCEMHVRDGVAVPVAVSEIEDQWFFQCFGHCSEGTKARYMRLFRSIAEDPANERDAAKVGYPANAGYSVFLWTSKSDKQVIVTLINGELDSAWVSPRGIGGYRS